MRTPTMPSATSVAGRAIAHFMKCPDDVLTLEDAADTFNTPVASLRSLLSDAVAAQYIVRELEHGDYVYKRGKNCPIAAPAPPPVRHFSAPPVAAAAPKQPRYEFIDPSKVVLEDGIPVLKARWRTPGEDWMPLLLKMKEGQSFVLPKSKRHRVSKVIAKAHKDKLGRWALAVLPDKVYFRVWRTGVPAPEQKQQ